MRYVTQLILCALVGARISSMRVGVLGDHRMQIGTAGRRAAETRRGQVGPYLGRRFTCVCALPTGDDGTAGPAVHTEIRLRCDMAHVQPTLTAAHERHAREAPASSQTSVPSTTPLPHLWQMLGSPEHVHPLSWDMQSPLQPSERGTHARLSNQGSPPWLPRAAGMRLKYWLLGR